MMNKELAKWVNRDMKMANCFMQKGEHFSNLSKEDLINLLEYENIEYEYITTEDTWLSDDSYRLTIVIFFITLPYSWDETKINYEKFNEATKKLEKFFTLYTEEGSEISTITITGPKGD